MSWQLCIEIHYIELSVEKETHIYIYPVTLHFCEINFTALSLNQNVTF